MILGHREAQVLYGLALGLTQKEVGKALEISPLTVKSHVSHILEKLDAKNTVHAVAIGIVRGEIHGPA